MIPLPSTRMIKLDQCPTSICPEKSFLASLKNIDRSHFKRFLQGIPLVTLVPFTYMQHSRSWNCFHSMMEPYQELSPMYRWKRKCWSLGSAAPTQVQQINIEGVQNLPNIWGHDEQTLLLDCRNAIRVESHGLSGAASVITIKKAANCTHVRGPNSPFCCLATTRTNQKFALQKRNNSNGHRINNSNTMRRSRTLDYLQAH